MQKMPLLDSWKAEKHCFQQDRGPVTVEQSSLLAFAVDFRLPDSPCPEGTGVVGQSGRRLMGEMGGHQKSPNRDQHGPCTQLSS